MTRGSPLCRLLVGLHLAALLLSPCCQALRFEVGSDSKCVAEEIAEGVLVVGDYSVVGGQTDHINKIAVKVMSPKAQDLHWVESTERGHFGFTTKEAGHFYCCMWVVGGSRGGPKLTVDLEWKTGMDAKDWASIAKKEKLDGMGLEMRKLEDAVRAVRDEMVYFKTREAGFRNQNERTNARVAWLSILSLFVCMALAALQLWHLKSFFERKKLL